MNHLLRIKEFCINITKQYSFPFFPDHSIYKVVSATIEELKKHNINTQANSIAFNMFLSLFPLIIFLLPIIARLPFADNFLNDLQYSMEDIIPQNARVYLIKMIEGLRSENQVGLQSISFLLSILFASNGMHTLVLAFDDFELKSVKQRSFWKNRVVALGLTILVSLLFVFSVLFVIFSQQYTTKLLSRFNENIYIHFIYDLVKWSGLVMSFYAIIYFIYRFGASWLKKISFFNIGVLIATLLSVLTCFVFSAFVDRFGQYNEIYGSIGALIVLLLWLKINSLILLIGFRLNAGISDRKNIQ